MNPHVNMNKETNENHINKKWINVFVSSNAFIIFVLYEKRIKSSINFIVDKKKVRFFSAIFENVLLKFIALACSVMRTKGMSFLFSQAARRR